MICGPRLGVGGEVYGITRGGLRGGRSIRGDAWRFRDEARVEWSGLLGVIHGHVWWLPGELRMRLEVAPG